MFLNKLSSKADTKSASSYMLNNTLCVIYTCKFDYITWSSKEDYSTDTYSETFPIEIESTDKLIDYKQLSYLVVNYIQTKKTELENEKVENDY